MPLRTRNSYPGLQKRKLGARERNTIDFHRRLIRHGLTFVPAMPLAAWIGPAGAADVARQVTIVGIIGVGMTMVILNLGNMFELDAIAAVVIGGTIIGALIIGVLNNGMSLLGVSSFYQSSRG